MLTSFQDFVPASSDIMPASFKNLMPAFSMTLTRALQSPIYSSHSTQISSSAFLKFFFCCMVIYLTKKKIDLITTNVIINSLTYFIIIE